MPSTEEIGAGTRKVELCFQQHEAVGTLNVLLQVVQKGLSHEASQMTSSSMDMLKMASVVVDRPSVNSRFASSCLREISCEQGYLDTIASCLADWEGTLASVFRAVKD